MILQFWCHPACLRIPRKNDCNFYLKIKYMFLVFHRILVSTGFRDRGGKTHLCGSFCHHSHTECEFSKITPIKHMLLEAIFGASAHIGPLGPKMGPSHCPMRSNDLPNMIFYTSFIHPSAAFWTNNDTTQHKHYTNHNLSRHTTSSRGGGCWPKALG